MALILKHQTPQQFIARVREAYRDGRQQQLVQIARFIVARLQAGDITDAQCRAAFGLNTTQWNALKNRMQNLIAAANALEGAVGE